MKKLEISKELLGEVFNQEVRFINYVANNTYEVHFEKPIRLKYIIINIYELAHKCKEWAKSKDYYILSGYDDTNIPVSLINNNYGEGGCNCDEYFEANTEPEAIFKACQWILDNKGGI